MNTEKVHKELNKIVEEGPFSRQAALYIHQNKGKLIKVEGHKNYKAFNELIEQIEKDTQSKLHENYSKNTIAKKVMDIILMMKFLKEIPNTPERFKKEIEEFASAPKREYVSFITLANIESEGKIDELIEIKDYYIGSYRKIKKLDYLKYENSFFGDLVKRDFNDEDIIIMVKSSCIDDKKAYEISLRKIKLFERAINTYLYKKIITEGYSPIHTLYKNSRGPGSETVYTFSLDDKEPKAKISREMDKYINTTKVPMSFLVSFFENHFFSQLISIHIDELSKIEQSLKWSNNAINHYNKDFNQAMAELAFAYESIFSFRGNENEYFLTESITRNISDNVVFLVSKNYAERLRLSKIIREFFKKRNEIVHGSKNAKAEIILFYDSFKLFYEALKLLVEYKSTNYSDNHIKDLINERKYS